MSSFGRKGERKADTFSGGSILGKRMYKGENLDS